MNTVNSFIDEEGYNSFMDCVEDLYNLKTRKAGTYTHLDGSVCCKKCNLTVSEGCIHY